MNADKPHHWKADIKASVDFYNSWFLKFAPRTYRTQRISVTAMVDQAIRSSQDLTAVTDATIQSHPDILPVLRMCCCPPIARERLSGLAGVGLPLIATLEKGKLPGKLKPAALQPYLAKLADTIRELLDIDLFPWLPDGRRAKKDERRMAASVVADRLCGSMSDPIIRNAQEARQRQSLEGYLVGKASPS
jgi:hypothetical protein